MKDVVIPVVQKWADLSSVLYSRIEQECKQDLECAWIDNVDVEPYGPNWFRAFHHKIVLRRNRLFECDVAMSNTGCPLTRSRFSYVDDEVSYGWIFQRLWSFCSRLTANSTASGKSHGDAVKNQGTLGHLNLRTLRWTIWWCQRRKRAKQMDDTRG